MNPWWPEVRACVDKDDHTVRVVLDAPRGKVDQVIVRCTDPGSAFALAGLINTRLSW